MNVLVALDKFKDSMTAEAACEVVEGAIRDVCGEEAQVQRAPLTDGGEGFARILTAAAAGELRQVSARDPRGTTVSASVGWVLAGNLPARARSRLQISNGTLAVLEMASVAGLEQVPLEDRHPSNCSTHGVGDLIAEAAREGADAILLGIGGSATSDIGMGALQALGLSCLDTDGEAISPLFPRDWHRIQSISGQISLQLPPIYVACDVENPLLGPNGAAAVYGPQKGLKDREISAFDREAERIARLLLGASGKTEELINFPGSGAAGGMGFGLVAACNAQLVPGFPLVTDWLGLPDKLSQADIVITGEGRFDMSSLSGKGPYALVEAATNLDKPSCVFSGSIDPIAADAMRGRFSQTSMEAISPTNLPLEQALRQGPENLRATAIRHLKKFTDS